MVRSTRLADYTVAAALTVLALAISPPGILLITGRAPGLRETVLFVVFGVFFLLIAGAILAQGRARRVFYHLLAWTFPIVVLAVLEWVAGATHLASRIAPFEDLSLFDHKGRWPAHLLSEARWAPMDRGVRVYRPWRGDGIFINELGLRTASPAPKAAGEWRIAISGGSTVWGWRVLDADTVPAGVQRLLKPGHPNVTVFNFGIEGATLATELATLKRFRHLYALDQVLFYTGANDVIYSYLHESRTRDEERRLRIEATGFELIKAARRLNALLQGAPPELLARLDRVVLPQLVRNNSLRAAIIAADQYCRATALRCDFALQPILPARASPVGPEARVAKTLRLVFPRLGVLARKMYRDAISAGPSDRIGDLTHILDPVRKPLFVDTAHLNEAGNRLVAAAILPILLRGAHP
jgi:lysophospholipase L1-like esterase